MTLSSHAVTVHDVAHRFDDSAAYEQFMGRWSRTAGALFLDWVRAPLGARWLDVGCGTGIFTGLILDKCSPAAVFGIDSAPAQVDHARRQLVGRRASFGEADARALPFEDASFDVVVSALALNFIPDRPGALSEMRRVVRLDGWIACYVWDFGQDLSPSWPLRLALREVGAEVPAVPGADSSSLEALAALFERAGFERIATRSFDVRLSFPSFPCFWHAQTPGYSPIAKTVANLSASDRTRLTRILRAALPAVEGGAIEYSARANGVRARRRG